MSNQTRTYTKKERNMYITGMLGQNLIYNIVATGLYFYFQNVICLPAMALGWIFALARVWDAINDPMMGTIVDRTRTKWSCWAICGAWAKSRTGRCTSTWIYCRPISGRGGVHG